MTFTLTDVGLLWGSTLQRLATFTATSGYGVETGLPGGGAEISQFPGPTRTGDDGLREECTGLTGSLVTGVLTMVITTP